VLRARKIIARCKLSARFSDPEFLVVRGLIRKSPHLKINHHAV
jgi:hypothetical protein